MCGIIGYIGKNKAAPILLDGLERLEYRGYDSAGMAVYDGEKINLAKAAGRLNVLYNLTRGGDTMPGSLGIGHTRWATHGGPNEGNAHPHVNENRTIAVVMNGIIENYLPIKKRLTERGYQFVSETDTEVLPHLLDHYYDGDPRKAIIKMLHRIEGSFALGIIFADHPDTLYAVRKNCPLIVGNAEGENFIASDVTAILRHTRDVVYVDNMEIAELHADRVEYYSMDEERLEKTPTTVDWDVSAAEKGGYE
ncbi:MAG: glutamine--fructose-6-phosphate aminotransferase, partial [Lachnospiraceae bacterium]|nr:glutamine--fructose-6-phosphate aminotransferase [Lachnospiraceae bacterium]